MKLIVIVKSLAAAVSATFLSPDAILQYQRKMYRWAEVERRKVMFPRCVPTPE
jgi:hypothetical protein